MRGQMSWTDEQGSALQDARGLTFDETDGLISLSVCFSVRFAVREGASHLPLSLRHDTSIYIFIIEQPHHREPD